MKQSKCATIIITNDNYSKSLEVIHNHLKSGSGIGIDLTQCNDVVKKVVQDFLSKFTYNPIITTYNHNRTLKLVE